MLGSKTLECFLWSADHDSDPEFLLRYGEPTRAAFMLKYHGTDPAAADACARLQSIL